MFKKTLVCILFAFNPLLVIGASSPTNLEDARQTYFVAKTASNMAAKEILAKPQQLSFKQIPNTSVKNKSFKNLFIKPFHFFAKKKKPAKTELVETANKSTKMPLKSQLASTKKEPSNKPHFSLKNVFAKPFNLLANFKTKSTPKTVIEKQSSDESAKNSLKSHSVASAKEKLTKPDFSLKTLFAKPFNLLANLKTKSKPKTVVANQSVPLMSTEAEDPNDKAIKDKIKALYAQSPAMQGSRIQLTCFNQNVVISGEVLNDSGYETAVNLAALVDGVDDINADTLEVKTNKLALIDLFINGKIKAALMKQNYLDKNEADWPIKVETKENIVYLTGKLKNSAQKAAIINIARAIDGVEGVNSAISVKG